MNGYITLILYHIEISNSYFNSNQSAESAEGRGIKRTSDCLTDCMFFNAVLTFFYTVASGAPIEAFLIKIL